MKVEIRIWVDGVEIDLAPRFVHMIETIAVPGYGDTWKERVRRALVELRSD